MGIDYAKSDAVPRLEKEQNICLLDNGNAAAEVQPADIMIKKTIVLRTRLKKGCISSCSISSTQTTIATEVADKTIFLYQ